jgi:Ran-binding protein 3
LFAPSNDQQSGASTFASFSFAAPSGESTFPSFGGSGETPEESAEASEEEEEPPVPASSIIADHADGEELLYQNDCRFYKLEKVEDLVMKWNEKGIGFVRLIKNTNSGEMRIVVRMKGVYRLMLNVGLVASLCKAEKVGNKSVKFTAYEDGSIHDFRLNMLTEDQQGAFMEKLSDRLKAPSS